MKKSLLFAASLMFLCLLTASGQANEEPGRRALPAERILPDTNYIDTLHADSLHHDTVQEKLHPLVWDNVMQNELIEFLLQSHRKAMMEQRGIQGFRVHLYMDSGNRARLNTQREQADFQELYPNRKSYIIYEEPYFKLRAGDFRTRLDARRFLEKIRSNYPAAYIVVDIINYPESD